MTLGVSTTGAQPIPLEQVLTCFFSRSIKASADSITKLLVAGKVDLYVSCLQVGDNFLKLPFFKPTLAFYTWESLSWLCPKSSDDYSEHGYPSRRAALLAMKLCDHASVTGDAMNDIVALDACQILPEEFLPVSPSAGLALETTCWPEHRSGIELFLAFLGGCVFPYPNQTQLTADLTSTCPESSCSISLADGPRSIERLESLIAKVEHILQQQAQKARDQQTVVAVDMTSRLQALLVMLKALWLVHLVAVKHQAPTYTFLCC